MDNHIINRDGAINSFQISSLATVPSGTTNFGKVVLLKNITDTDISLEILPAGNTNYITTKLYPGWNVELVLAVKGVTSNTLQYGY